MSVSIDMAELKRGDVANDGATSPRSVVTIHVDSPNTKTIEEVKPKTNSRSTTPVPTGPSECAIKWSHVTKRVADRKDPNKKFTILNSVSGEIQTGQLTALMGASGSGKTSLLNVLAGRSNNIDNGVVELFGKPATKKDFRKFSSYVTQDDILPEFLTAEEVLDFSCRLRLPNPTPETRASAVKRVLAEMDLTDKKDLIVGKPGQASGLSGGQRKRVNIGQGLVTDPRILMLDEPTSGLDSRTAKNVISLLRRLAHEQNKAILVTIHQPAEECFNLFDRVILLASGEVAYSGPLNEVEGFFKKVGYDKPPGKNPADFVIECLSNIPENEKEEVGHEAVQKRTDEILAIVDRYRTEAKDERYTGPETPLDMGGDEVSYTASFREQMSALMYRSFKTQVRNPMLVRARLGQTIAVSLLIGIIYLQLGLGQSSVQNRLGALFLICVNNFILSTMAMLFSIPAERAVIIRDQESGLYSVTAYFITKLNADLPFQIIFPSLYCVILYWMVGFQNSAEQFFLFLITIILVSNFGSSLGFLVSGITGDVSTSLAIAPVTFLPIMLFSGFLVQISSVTWVLRWFSYPNPIRYAFAAIVKNEFTGLVFTCNSPIPQACPWQNGEQVLSQYDLGDLTKWENVLVLLGLFVFVRIMGAIGLNISVARELKRRR